MLNLLWKKDVQIDNTKYFDQLSTLKKFVATYDGNFKYQEVLQLQCIEYCTSEEQYNEILKIACSFFFFVIPAHRTCVETVFSLAQAIHLKKKTD